MKFKTAALLLLIGTVNQLLLMSHSVYNLLQSEESKYFSPGQIIIEDSFIIGATVGFFLLGLSLLRNKNTEKLKVAAGILVAASAAHILYLVFKRTEEYQILSSYWSENRWLTLSRTYIPLLANIVLGIGFFLNRSKMAAWGLLISGTIKSVYVLQIVTFVVVVLLGDTEITGEMYFYQFTSIFSAAIPLGMLLLTDDIARQGQIEIRDTNPSDDFTAAYTSSDLLDDQFKKAPELSGPKVSGGEYNSVLWWMSTFALSVIPLIGLGFLVYFSISKKHVKRGNWAVASLLVAMLNTLFYIFLFSREAEGYLTSKELGFIIIGVILVLGTLAVICSGINKRNQDDISLDNHAYGPTVTGWIGYMVLMIIPLANLICLIVFAASENDKYRQKWAQARLLWVPFTLISYMIYSGLLEDLVRMIGRF